MLEGRPTYNLVAKLLWCLLLVVCEFVLQVRNVVNKAMN